MDRLVAFAISRRYLMVGLFVAVLVGGLIAFQQLNIEAYPDPTPPMVDIVTQSPGLSSEEIERYITIQTKPRKQKTEIFSIGAVARSPRFFTPLKGPNRMGTSLGLLGPLLRPNCIPLI